MMLIEEIVESLCVQTPIIIQNVCVLLGDHRSLCMTGIALHGFDIAAVQLELVCNAGVSEAVENHFGEIKCVGIQLELIREYAAVFGKGTNYHYYIFSKGGFTDGLLQAQERGEVQLLTLADIFE